MKRALISPDEITNSYDGSPLGSRVAMVADTCFEVALPLFWVDCDDDVLADVFYWDGNAIVPVPAAPAPTMTPIETVPGGGPNIVA